MKARLSRPKRSNPSVAWEGNSERRGRAKRAQRACEPERKESAAFSLGRLVFAAAAGWAEKRRAPMRRGPPFLPSGAPLAPLAQKAFSTACCSTRPGCLGWPRSEVALGAPSLLRAVWRASCALWARRAPSAARRPPLRLTANGPLGALNRRRRSEPPVPAPVYQSRRQARLLSRSAAPPPLRPQA